MSPRRRALILTVGGGLAVVVLLAAFELFFSSIVYDADFGSKSAMYRSPEKNEDFAAISLPETKAAVENPNNTPNLRMAEVDDTLSPRAVELDNTTSLRGTEVNRTGNPSMIETPQSSPRPSLTDAEYTWSPTGAEVNISQVPREAAVNHTENPEVAKAESTMSPTIADISNTRSPTLAKINSTQSPTVAEVNTSRGPKSTEAGTGTPTSSDTQVIPLQSTPTPREAEDILWALVVHFTGKPDRFKSVTSTWFKRTHPRMAIIIFTSEKNRALVNSSGIPTVYYSSNETVTDHTLNAIRTALSMFPNAVYISKGDDDGYVYTQRLANTLFSSIPYNYQGFRCAPLNGLIKLGRDFVYACGGSGYTLTRYAAEKLVNLANPPQHIDYEDVGVGLRLKYALGSEFGLHAIDVHARNFWNEISGRPEHGPPLSYHYVTPPVMNMMHEEAYQWWPIVRHRASVPRIFHHLESEPIHQSCTELNPNWTVMTWTPKSIRGLSRASQSNSTLVQYDVLFRHGGIYLKPGDRCKQPLDVRLDQFAKDFDHDGYYLAYNFHEHGYRSGLFVIRPLSDVSMTLYHFAERNLRNHPLEYLKSSRINVAVLPAAGLFERG